MDGDDGDPILTHGANGGDDDDDDAFMDDDDGVDGSLNLTP